MKSNQEENEPSNISKLEIPKSHYETPTTNNEPPVSNEEYHHIRRRKSHHYRMMGISSRFRI
jgi:hypothetical protein